MKTKKRMSLSVWFVGVRWTFFLGVGVGVLIALFLLLGLAWACHGFWLFNSWWTVC